uniref:Protein farnesyltransferase/geranylgeranyltransferase type-1 subunit alpha n=1 Tax=Mucochytrium quahogii TaxID=96639 RepID=A0A7S2WEP3_9STRA|mmetsp:Transcript_3354/g.4862  ORF Transcript_3354/g.4862 Transcript_3354/m.4862 type:complete len:321 (-) Transcript_3354:29-991(-)|eukprot:CAMPEP_0203753586 /NCGR_PEP_ID=MMETSP0098-20131031/7338_1 /ASSEMBLY_ACC=CAM_ASM_000208 /TAXON_ID=96639 /ORGANISM=" , Strain NY0313808BC1" /LENGTH=320 /DNA_ID=CAMNT_0050644255 /DNA_START=154 /DNA_END=1116 /DNA_ORIENTATION=-
MDPYFRDERWSDVVPIPQPESDMGCGQIAYQPKFAETMSYFRAILKLEEKSERALELTERVVQGNAANYTAWFFRRECLYALKADLGKELEFVTSYAYSSPKNYQIWYHRRAIVDRLGDGAMELDFLNDIINDDAKNYHAWAYRQFVLERFNLWDGEMEFVMGLIDIDIRNNSAWNQKWFLIEKTTGFTKEVREREIDYAFDKASVAPNNESPYNYIRGLMRLDSFAELTKVESHAVDLLEKVRTTHGAVPGHTNAANPAPLLSLLVEVHRLQGRQSEAIQLCEDLATLYDTVRVKYWGYRKERICAMHDSAAPPIAPVD